jgi:putative ABC transport system substrate-binding protein
MQIHQLGRREFITLLGSAAVCPLVAHAQQAMPVVGHIHDGLPEIVPNLLAAFRKGLSETGYVEGRNVAIEYRYSYNDPARLVEAVADLVRRRVSVIATPNSQDAAGAAKAATTTIPIVFGGGTDPVKSGLVASYNRPGGNVTGVVTMNAELVTKRLGLLHQLLPRATRVAVLVNPNNAGPVFESMMTEVREAAATIGLQIDVIYAGTSRDFDTAFASAVQKRADALLTFNSSLFGQQRTTGGAGSAPCRAGHVSRSHFADQRRRVGIYVGRILKGEKPADLPVLLPTKFELVINLKTASAMGLDVSPDMLSISDEVIE